MMSPGDMSSGGAVPATHDLDEVALDDEGWFDVILSAERPAGHTGDWWQLAPTTKRLLMRKCSCDWRNEQDARVAIDASRRRRRRHDPGGDRPTVLRPGRVDRSA